MDDVTANPIVRIPTVMIGGFLGAGKTTLVNRILSNANERRIVVFVNDFAAINLDVDLIDEVATDRVSLKNGCVCCSLNADFITSMAQACREVPKPEAFIVETSGVADPRNLEASIAGLEAAQLVRLDAKLYVVDAQGFGELEADDQEMIIDHCAGSDILLVNKVDLASREAVSNMHRLLAEAAPFSKRVETVNCDIDLELLVGLEPSRPQSCPTAARIPTTVHNQRYQSVSLTSDKPIDRAGLEGFARALASTCLRAKGLLRFCDDPGTVHAFHLVGYRSSLEEMPHLRSTTTQLVAIGKAGRFAASEVERAFLALLSSPASVKTRKAGPDR